ncbi:unnamed protein product, partial [marine sediment metagenome]
RLIWSLFDSLAASDTVAAADTLVVLGGEVAETGAEWLCGD